MRLRSFAVRGGMKARTTSPQITRRPRPSDEAAPLQLSAQSQVHDRKTRSALGRCSYRSANPVAAAPASSQAPTATNPVGASPLSTARVKIQKVKTRKGTVQTKNGR